MELAFFCTSAKQCVGLGGFLCAGVLTLVYLKKEKKTCREFFLDSQ